MKVVGDLTPATVKAHRARPPQGSESAPSQEPHPALIDEGIEIFSRRYGRTVGREEAHQIIERLTAFFDLLAEWQDRAQGGPVEGDVAA